ncbi:hypothetical protein Back2_01030 [Nocardioides baekrokdamisoli]|uniref:RDD domain-containing protein n=1 Tax=Nocardioides baekrokdamisoli TaxID=1804624 RepID=A0A3G9IBZ3_9ACTN|nr:RDD family protein [Nocardioides baekrokdamisoli]BBH15816.1 hypothetical protein Back2_01030 [Nocardioides baekrokdamisoli]
MVAELGFDNASWAHRMLALAVDWLACIAIVVAVVGSYKTSQSFSLGILGAFVVESAILTATVGGSFGQIATRLRVVRVDGDRRPLDLVRAFARQILVALFVPPLVFRPDGRGLHDLAVGTATVTLATYRDLVHTEGER